MKRISSALSAALLLASISQASAASVTEELTIFYNNTTASTYTLSSLFFGNGDNLLSGFSPSYTLGAKSTGQLFSQQVQLDTATTYTFSGVVGGSTFNRSVTVPESVGSINFPNIGNNDFSFVLVAESMSPVPLPASAPLFALALIALGGFAFFGNKRKPKIVDNASVQAT